MNFFLFSSSTFKRVFRHVNFSSVKFRGRRVAKTVYFDRNILGIRKFLENRAKLLFERNMNFVFTSVFFFSSIFERVSSRKFFLDRVSCRFPSDCKGGLDLFYFDFEDS